MRDSQLPAATLFVNLLEQAAAHPEKIAEHSVLDHHAKGLDYLNLMFTPNFSVKLYMNRPGEMVTCGTRDFLVNPHDHGYNFNTIVLHGHVSNINFNYHPAGDLYYGFRYDWRDKSITWQDRVALMPTRTRYEKFENYYLNHSVIHTISVPKDEEVMLMLLQFKDIPKGPTKLFLPTKNIPSMEGLYRKPTIPETKSLIEKALRLGGL